MSFANADKRPKKKYDRTTMAIRNAVENADIKAITLNKPSTKLKGKCLKIPQLLIAEPLGHIPKINQNKYLSLTLVTQEV